MSDISLNRETFLHASLKNAVSKVHLVLVLFTNCSFHHLSIEKDQCHTSAYKRLYGTE